MKDYPQKITAEEFVRIWQQAGSLDEVAQKVGSSREACYSRARYYRSRSVPLKPLDRRRVFVWPKLIALAESLQEQPK